MTLRQSDDGAVTAASRRPSARRTAGESREVLSRNSYTPLYYQLTAILEERIESGDYPAGEEFPSESALCEEFDVSRTVVRPAMAILEREGRISRSKGKRTLVCPPKSPRRMGGVLRALTAAGGNDASELRLLETRSEAPELETAALLGLASGERVLRVAAIAYERDVPLALHWSFVPAEEFGWLADLPVGPRLTGAEPAIPVLGLGRGEATVESSWCTEFEASELDVPVGTPIFVSRGIERLADDGTGANGSGSAVEVAWTMYRADAARLHVAFEPSGPEPTR